MPAAIDGLVYWLTKLIPIEVHRHISNRIEFDLVSDSDFKSNRQQRAKTIE